MYTTPVVCEVMTVSLSMLGLYVLWLSTLLVGFHANAETTLSVYVRYSSVNICHSYRPCHTWHLLEIKTEHILSRLNKRLWPWFQKMNRSVGIGLSMNKKHGPRKWPGKNWPTWMVAYAFNASWSYCAIKTVFTVRSNVSLHLHVLLVLLLSHFLT
jgi:hypothetical protein